MRSKYEFEGAIANVNIFAPKNKIIESHVLICATNVTEKYERQLNAITNALQNLLDKELKGCKIVFKRYFLSDSPNQEEFLKQSEKECNYALSIVQQAPLNGTKIALWAWLMSDATPYRLSDDSVVAQHGAFKHIWTAHSAKTNGTTFQQARDLLDTYSSTLLKEKCSLEDNCLRTWFYVHDIDRNYNGVVSARNEVFDERGLTNKTHFIASTGIGFCASNPYNLVHMDAYAVKGIVPEQITYLKASSHLNRTSEYGVRFERGTKIKYGDRNHIFISGTASINNKGEVAFPKDIQAQTWRMLDNIEALLNEADATFNDICQAIIYLRDSSDYTVVKSLLQERFPNFTPLIVQAPVCRQAWLIEMECIAQKTANNKGLPDF